MVRTKIIGWGDADTAWVSFHVESIVMNTGISLDSYPLSHFILNIADGEM